MARRARPRGHIEERPNGKVRAVVYAGKDALTGRPRYLKKTADGEKQAKVELSKLLTQVDEQRQPRTNITVSQTVCKWLEVADHARSTRKRLEQLIRDYIDPTFGTMAFGKLDPELLERFYARLMRCKALCDGRNRGPAHDCRGLSNSSIRQVHFILRAAGERAVRWGYIGINPAALAEPPAFKRPEPDPPDPAEIAAVINEAWAQPTWGLLLWLVMITGCRRGELCVLRWTDLDLDRGTVRVARSSEQAADGTIQEKETKSGQTRRISLDTYTVGLLRHYRSTCQDQCQQLGVELPRSAFVFSGSPDFSTPIRPDTVSQRYRLALRNNLRSTRLHPLRHYSATELLNAGIDLRIVAGRLGHGRGGATTLRFYTAWADQPDRRAADAIAASIPRPDPLRRTPRSPYELLAAKLRKSIEAGAYPPGSILPTSTELATDHDVSVGTVSRAIGLLKVAGLVNATRGRRVTVRDCPPA